jgi:YVTN family beta-propeller protein
VIDGASNAAATVAAGSQPVAVAVNPVTNKAYVANNGSGNVTVIDGASNTTTTVAAGINPRTVAIDPATNKIYVANNGSGNVTVIDGASNATTTVTAESQPVAVAANPVTHKIHVANQGSNSVTAITPAPANTNAMQTTIDVTRTSPRGGEVPVAFTANTSLMGTPDSSRQVYYQLDTLQGPWQLATGSAPSYTASLQNPALGAHVVYAFAVDGSHVDAAQVGSPVIGPVAATVFTVDNVPPPPTPTGSATTRSEESAATEIGFWTTYGAETGTFSGGSIVASNVAASTAMFSFTGTAVSWIGVKCNVCGIAAVSIDGGAPATVNTAGPNAPGGLTSESVFSASGLAAASHTMIITVTGLSSSGDAYVAVDAFDVTAGSATSPLLPPVVLPPPPVVVPPLPPVVGL